MLQEMMVVLYKLQMLACKLNFVKQCDHESISLFNGHNKMILYFINSIKIYFNMIKLPFEENNYHLIQIDLLGR